MTNVAFPTDFLWGTSTAAAQVETPYDHDWKGWHARDGSVLGRAIEHELHREEDADIIASLGNAYRFSFDWSRLQRGPRESLDAETVREYRAFMESLKERGMHLMLVLHHFAEPRWFTSHGSWRSRDAEENFMDYAGKVVGAFGDLVDSWNTFNEPTVFTYYGYLTARRPPKRLDPLGFIRTIRRLSAVHNLAYAEIKERFPDAPVGVSHNTMVFEPETLLGRLPAAIADHFALEVVPSLFNEVDFVGLSYYGKVPFVPYPVSEIDTPGKLARLNRPHDKMWEYHPEGLTEILLRLSERFQKPLIVTENGCCTDDDTQRVQSIADHVKACHGAMQQGVDLRGYFHWSAFDNFEWDLGMSYRFGLVDIDPVTMERRPKPSAAFYAEIARSGGLANYKLP